MSRLLQKLLIASSIATLAGMAQAQGTGGGAGLSVSSDPSASTANDPYVKRREEKKAAKEEYKARKKAAKAEYKAEKKEANAELKAAGTNAASNNSDLYPNGTTGSSGK